jgi:hypothetical protein
MYVQLLNTSYISLEMFSDAILMNLDISIV